MYICTFIHIYIPICVYIHISIVYIYIQVHSIVCTYTHNTERPVNGDPHHIHVYMCPNMYPRTCIYICTHT